MKYIIILIMGSIANVALAQLVINPALQNQQEEECSTQLGPGYLEYMNRKLTR